MRFLILGLFATLGLSGCELMGICLNNSVCEANKRNMKKATYTVQDLVGAGDSSSSNSTSNTTNSYEDSKAIIHKWDLAGVTEVSGKEVKATIQFFSSGSFVINGCNVKGEYRAIEGSRSQPIDITLEKNDPNVKNSNKGCPELDHKAYECKMQNIDFDYRDRKDVREKVHTLTINECRLRGKNDKTNEVFIEEATRLYN